MAPPPLVAGKQRCRVLHPDVALFATSEPALSEAEGVGFHACRALKVFPNHARTDAPGDRSPGSFLLVILFAPSAERVLRLTILEA